MVTLGLDPGIGRTGWGVVDEEKGKIKAVAYGCVETEAGGNISERILKIYKNISGLFDKYKIDVLAVEELFFNTNAKTALTVGQARGVLLLAGAEKNIPIAVYTPLQVKIAITGYGRADKNQIGNMIKTLLNLPAVPKPDDVTDALAIAIAHVFSNKIKNYDRFSER